MSGQRPIVIAAGGTGGHFFPAEALAAALLARGARVVLLTDARAQAAKSVAFAGCEIHLIAGAGMAGRNVLRALAGAAAILRGVSAARAVLSPLRAAAVVGFGGYPSVAPLLAARTLSPRPVLILHDQNAVLGKANRLLARLADRIAISFPTTAGLPARAVAVLTGNPVRPAIVALAGAAYVAPAGRINLLVLGGSLGATVFATLIPAALALLPAALRERIDLTMQCPAMVSNDAQGRLAAAQVASVLAPFFADVAALLAAAHLVIGRAGGSTVAELAVVGRPAVLIPLTINADQRANAAAMVAAGAAVCVEQGAGAAALAQALQNLLETPGRLAAMAQAARRCGITDAAARLADLLALAPVAVAA